MPLQPTSEQENLGQNLSDILHNFREAQKIEMLLCIGKYTM